MWFGRLPVAAALGAVALLAGCAGGSGPADGDPEAAATTHAPPPGMQTALLQYTFDVVNEEVVVQVRNTSARPFTLTRLDVDAPGFTDMRPMGLGTVVEAGLGYDIRVPYGEPLCEVEPRGVPRLHLEVEGYGAPVVVTPGSGTDLYERLHEQLCGARRAAAAVPMRWLGDWRVRGSGDDAVATGTLLVGPVRENDVQLMGINPTTQFTLDPRGELGFGAGETAEVRVVLRPSRCDAHAVGESHQGFLFQVRLRFLEDDREALVPVPPEAGARPLLTQYLLDRCGLDAGGRAS